MFWMREYCCLYESKSCFDVHEQKHKSAKIDRLLRIERKEQKNQIKILLLGAGDSGKSTFLKQMKIIHNIHFEDKEIREYRRIIYENVVRGMQTLVDACVKLKIRLEDNYNYINGQNLIQTECKDMEMQQFRSVAPLLNCLWKDSGIKLAFTRRREFQLADSVEYYLNDLARISKYSYLPNSKDILLCRKTTKGVSEVKININNIPFVFVDIGGQRAQRQFDQILMEDRKTNRLEESIQIYDTIINNNIFSNMLKILFLNKHDLLVKKIADTTTNISWYYPKYTGDPHSVKEVEVFIAALFSAVKRDPSKKVFQHFTSTVDTENMTHVFSSIKGSILNKNVQNFTIL
ncbi:PREDICTED: guanine nucleotide-binding protein subunit alpha homolog [Nicrophorus vespilloides]|uniref:Guanine nucleotide-binding protein subunit alpha homolog n=1 Tax=Nicrophorus vespilloides TaxID=110193 RepID=A0ABM1MZJ1_NICVS|nr:PREDICTED: guanine nucleotide-binding protein subunit alpha homolog [Nicrophorus vespilloides]